MTATVAGVERVLELFPVEGKVLAILAAGPDQRAGRRGCGVLRVWVWTDGERRLLARRVLDGQVVLLDVCGLRKVSAEVLRYRRGGLIWNLRGARVLRCEDPGAEALITILRKGIPAHGLSVQQKMLRRKRAETGLRDAWKLLTVKQDVEVARYALARHLLYMVQCYYQLNQRPAPDPPDMLKDLREHNPFLHSLCVGVLTAADPFEQYARLERMVKYIVEPHGGFLPAEWSIPLDRVALRDLLGVGEEGGNGNGHP